MRNGSIIDTGSGYEILGVNTNVTWELASSLDTHPVEEPIKIIRKITRCSQEFEYHSRTIFHYVSSCLKPKFLYVKAILLVNH